MDNNELLQMILHELQDLKTTTQAADDKLNERLSTIEAAQESMDGQLSKMDERLSTIEAAQESVDGRLSKIEATQESMDGRLSTIDERLTKVELTQENEVAKKISLLIEAQKETHQRVRQLDELHDQVDDIQTTVSVLKALTVKK